MEVNLDNELKATKLKDFQVRLENDVWLTIQRNYDLGLERWESWLNSVENFIEYNIPSKFNILRAKVNPPSRITLSDDRRTKEQRFYDRKIKVASVFIESLIMDIRNNEAYLIKKEIPSSTKTSAKKSGERIKAFIVHGHDETAKIKTARFLEKLGFEAVILHEQASSGKTIIEKLEHFTDVSFAIVLYTPDDQGASNADIAAGKLKHRARQNVVFEHGLLIGKLGRSKVFPLVTDHNIELPNDISGVVYLSDRNWEIDLAKEIKAAGFEVDFNKLL